MTKTETTSKPPTRLGPTQQARLLLDGYDCNGAESCARAPHVREHISVPVRATWRECEQIARAHGIRLYVVEEGDPRADKLGIGAVAISDSYMTYAIVNGVVRDV